MIANETSAYNREQHLDEVIAAYLKALRAGQARPTAVAGPIPRPGRRVGRVLRRPGTGGASGQTPAGGRLAVRRREPLAARWAITSCWKRSAGVGWAWCTRRGKSARAAWWR